jgi:hypothetical protein
MSATSKIISLLVVVGSTLAPAVSQGICVPSPLNVNAVAGHVFFKRSGNPVMGATIELLSFDRRQSLLVEAKSGSDGHFAISPPRNGKYWLRVRDEHLGSFTVEIRFDPKSKSKNAARDEIRFFLDLDPEKSCWGSSVVLAH